MRISAKADYAVRATLELASSPDGKPIKGTKLADAQDIPLQFLEHILLDLKRAGIVRTKRGAQGGYWLAQAPNSVSIADIIRSVEGPLAYIQDLPPEETKYEGSAVHLRSVWIAVRQTLREVLEQTTLDQVVAGELPAVVTSLLKEPGALVARGDTGSHPAVR
jgi:Rrf2 family protein